MTIDLVLTDASLLDLGTLRALRRALPAARRERSDRYDRAVDRRTSVVVFAQLQRLWAERQGGPMPTIAVGRFGKPDFRGDIGLHFNWSHDRSLCACALSPVPVGVDISGPVSFDHDLFSYMAAPGEIPLAGYLSRRDDMSPLWTRKEATVKRSGQGLHTPLKEVDTTTRNDILTFTCETQRFSISLNLSGLSEQTVIENLSIRLLAPVDSTVWSEEPMPPLNRLNGQLEVI